MKKITYFIAALFIASAIFTGCSKDDDKTDEGTKPSELAKPSLASKTEFVKVPAGLTSNTNPGASMCVSAITMVNSLTQWNSAFTVPDNAKKISSARKSTASDTYTWSNGQQTVWYEYGETSDKYSWTIYYSANNMPKSKVIYAEENKTGKAGKTELYDWGQTGNMVGYWTWSTDAAGTIDFLYKIVGDNEMGYNVIVKSDGSGKVSLTDKGVKIYEASWDTAGHGNYTYYNDGGSNMTGTF